MPYQIRRLGWLPDIPDHRDFTYAAPTAVLKEMPARIDLRKQCPTTVYDQGNLGSCTANSIAGAIEFDQIKQRQPHATPSRLFIYYNERAIEHSVQLDAGAQIRDGIKSVAKLGVCPETMWPYDDTPPETEDSPCPTCKFAQKPSAACYTAALKHQILVYRRVPQDLNSMKGCLASGYPFVLGFTCYSSLPFKSTTGEIPLPSSHDHAIGGHAVLAVGYDDAHHRILIRNSWGPGWGAGGYGSLPYAYLLSPNLADDFWTIRTVE
jgi:C1A family cysteine protease